MPSFKRLFAFALLVAMPVIALAADSTVVPPPPGSGRSLPRSSNWDLRAPDRVSPDAADSVLWAIQRAAVTRYVRYDRLRKRGERDEREEARDSTEISSSWLLRFERQCVELPPSPCRPTTLVLGQTYAYNFRIVAPDAAGAPRIDLDFRGLCVRFARNGRVVAGRTMIGREREMVALLQRVRPQDATLDRLADAFQPQPMIEPPPPPTEPIPTDPPALGQYVYVEELPEPIHKETPIYPEAARAAGVEGTVTVQALVGRDGRVVKTQVTRGVPMLNEAAAACVAKWIFKPALSANEPVMVWIAVPISFKLH